MEGGSAPFAHALLSLTLSAALSSASTWPRASSERPGGLARVGTGTEEAGLRVGAGMAAILRFVLDDFGGTLVAEFRECLHGGCFDECLHGGCFDNREIMLVARDSEGFADFGFGEVNRVTSVHIKPIHKNRVRDNFDWLFAQIVARELAGDKRITFAISESPDFAYSVYNTSYHLTHGDQAKGGSGIAAQLSPLMIMVARKMKRFKFDYLVCGHWHRLSSFMKVRCNGSLVGYNEYAFNGNFEYEPPQQDLWLTDPQHGVVGSFPIHVQSSQEPWLLKAKQAA